MLCSKKPRMFEFTSVVYLFADSLQSSYPFSRGKDFMLEAINVLKGVGWSLTGICRFTPSNHPTRCSVLKTRYRLIPACRACQRWRRPCLPTRGWDRSPFPHNLFSIILGHRLKFPPKPWPSVQGLPVTHSWIPLRYPDPWRPHHQRLKSETLQGHRMTSLSTTSRQISRT